MTNKKPVLLFLLMLCIGLGPLQVLNAANIDNTGSMSTNCAHCDMGDEVAHVPCADTQCMMSAGLCWAQNITSVPSGALWTPAQRHAFMNCWHIFEARYRSHLDFSIYRPPIS